MEIQNFRLAERWAMATTAAAWQKKRRKEEKTTPNKRKIEEKKKPDQKQFTEYSCTEYLHTHAHRTDGGGEAA